MGFWDLFSNGNAERERELFKQRRAERDRDLKNTAIDVLNAMGDLIDIDRELKDKLSELLSSIRKFMQMHRENKKIAIGTKLVGAATTITGALTLPFSGGTSSLMMVYGAAIMAYGSVVEHFLEWLNSKQTQIYLEELRRVAERHDNASKRLKVGVNSYVSALDACAENNDPMTPSADIIKALALSASMVVLSPIVVKYVQRCMSTVWRSFNLSARQTNLIANIGQGIFVALQIVSAICLIIDTLKEIEDINKPHPVESKVIGLRDQLDFEIEQLKRRKEYC